MEMLWNGFVGNAYLHDKFKESARGLAQDIKKAIEKIKRDEKHEEYTGDEAVKCIVRSESPGNAYLALMEYLEWHGDLGFYGPWEDPEKSLEDFIKLWESEEGPDDPRLFCILNDEMNMKTMFMAAYTTDAEIDSPYWYLFEFMDMSGLAAQLCIR